MRRRAEHVLKPLLSTQGSRSVAHGFQTEKHEAHAEKHAGDRPPKRLPHHAGKNACRSDEVGDEWMDIERDNERERGESDIAPKDHRRCAARGHEPAPRHSRKDERHGRGALHQCAEADASQARQQRSLAYAMNGPAKTRAGKPAQIFADELNPEKKQPEPKDQQAQAVHGMEGDSRPIQRGGFALPPRVAGAALFHRARDGI